MESRLGLVLFGTFEVTVGEHSLTPFATEQVRTLLAFLALTANQIHSRHSLAAWFWSEWTDAEALANLRRLLYRLRASLDEHAPGLYERLLSQTRYSIQLNDEYLSLDVRRFQTLIDKVKEHTHQNLPECDDCVKKLTDAVELYKGDLWEPNSLRETPALQEWMAQEKLFLQNEFVFALEQLASAQEQRGDFNRAYAYAMRQLGVNAFHEEAHRQVMRALAQMNRRSEAIGHYQNYRQMLIKELQTEPDAQTVALYEWIIRGTFPLKPIPGRMVQFPHYTTRFVGRQQEIARIHELMRQPNTRLLTIVGPGGIGKTRLAVEAVERYENKTAYTDGIYFTSFSDSVRGDYVPTFIGSALGLDVSKAQDAAKRVREHLLPMRCLIILDSVVLSDTTIQFLLDVLYAAPNVQFLVTSRRSLNLQIEQRLYLTGLPCPETDIALEDSLEDSVISLFVNGARNADPLFELTDEGLLCIIRICQLVMGMPLAIEIAAAWARIYTPCQIAANISRSVEFLESPLQDIPERHRSMNAVFMDSWMLLSPEEQRCLAELSRFRGTFTLEEAMAVSGASSKVLFSLFDRSLLLKTEQSQYMLHGLLRRFAEKKLAEMESNGNPEDSQP